MPRRFYERAWVEAAETGFTVVLDGRPLHTPRKALLALPGEALAEAIAEEWQQQGARIDVDSMPLTRLANTAIDRVAAHRQRVIEELVAYAGADQICYRAAGPEKLVARQERRWRPLVTWAEREFDASPVLIEGVIHQPQPEALLAAVRARLEAFDVFALAGLHAVTTLTASALIALALKAGEIGAEAAWAAAHVDEDWQAEQWGRDEEAERRRARRHAEMGAAVRLLDLL